MKTNFLKLAAFGAIALGALISCDKNKVQEVQFPESLGTITVEPGQQVELTFKALFDWELSIEGDDASSDWFWFNEGSQPVLKITGKKSDTVTAILNVSDEIEYDTNRSCKVFIYMTGKPMLLATIVRPATELVFNLYSAKSDENGYISDDEGVIIYNEEPLTAEESTSLIWVPESGKWGMSFHANSSFAWELSGVPDWLDVYGLSNDSAVAAGDVEFYILADIAKMPIDGEEFTLEVKKGSDVMGTYKLTLPSSKDLVSSDVAEKVNFLPDGKLDDEMGQTFLKAQFTSAQGLQVYAIAKHGAWAAVASAEDPLYNWVSVEEWFGWEEGGAQIQDQTYKITMSANDTGEDRLAYIVALPGTVELPYPDFLFEENEDGTGNDIKEQFKKYIVSTLTQSAKTEFLKMGESANCVFRPIAQDGQAPYEKEVYESTSMYGIPVYILVLTDSEETYASFDVQAYTNITFNNLDLSDRTEDKVFAIMEPDKYGNLTCAPIPGKCGDEDQVMLVVFWNGGEMPVAIVYCVYSKGYVDAPAGAPFSFAYPENVSGATLAPVTDNDIISSIKGATGISNTSNIWQLTYTTKEPSMAMVNVPYLPSPWAYQAPDEGEYWLTWEKMGETQILVSMREKYMMDFFMFQKSMMDPVDYVLVCTYAAPEL